MNLTRASSRDVRVLHRFVTRAAKLLGVNTSSREVSRSFDALLQEIRQALHSYPDSLRAAAAKHMLKTSEIFGAKLFTRYDHPDLPPTNNDLEGVFRLIRRHERLITGHKSTARHTVRDGPFLLPALERIQRGLPSIDELSGIPEKTWRGNLETIRATYARYDRPRRLRVGLKVHLKDLVKRCRQLLGARGP